MGHVGSEVSFESTTTALLPSTSYTTSTPKRCGEATLSSSSASSCNFSTPNSTMPANNIPSCSNNVDAPSSTLTNHSDVKSPNSWEFSPVAQNDRYLSSNREMIDSLDSEPILDYLVRNGAITSQEYNALVNNDWDENVSDVTLYDADEHKTRNIRLLEIVEKNPRARMLFTNALRLTGQHHLANMADDGARIKALSGSGYLSKSRHKGEVELYVRVKSVKSIDDETFRAVSQLLHKDWISLEDIQMKYSSLRRQHQQQRNSALMESHGKENKKNVNTKKKQCCFCCCICCCSRKRNLSSDTEIPLASLSNVTKDSVVTHQPGAINGSTTRTTAVDIFKDNMEDLKKVSDRIQKICQDIYDQFADTNSSSLHKLLARYFEQDRSVLLLETASINNKLQVKFICTKLEQLDSVENDIKSGKLVADLEKLVRKWSNENEGKEEGITFDLKVVGATLKEVKEELLAG